MAYTPTVWSDGDVITAENLNKLEQGVANEQVGPPGTPGKNGDPGADGATFTPTVSSEGVLSWTNDGGLPNPAPVNIKGAPGTPGTPGTAGTDGEDGFSPTVTVTDITGGHRVTITDASGQHTFDVMDGQDGSGGGSAGVSSFNGRSGAVVPGYNDYTAAMVGARPADWIPSADQVSLTPPTGMTATNVQSAVSELFQSVSEGKALIASAVTDKGVETSADATFETMKDNILAIPSGGVPEGVYTITLETSNPQGGSVSGGGLVSEGMVVTVTASVVEGYKFSGWRENGAVVSKNKSYTFTVTNDTVLTALFDMYVLEWAEVDLPSSVDCQAAAYGEGAFVAIGYNKNVAFYSEDGINWDTTSIATGYWSNCVYGNGKFVAISGSGSQWTNAIAYSEDGKTWKTATLPASNYWCSLAYGNGRFVALARGSKTAAYSDNGIDWVTMTLDSSYVSHVSFAGDKFIITYDGATISFYSEDGVNWTQNDLPASGYWRNIAYLNGAYVALSGYDSGGDKDTYLYSTDGLSWEEKPIQIKDRWTGIACGNGLFVAISYNGNKSVWSTDGIEWVEVPFSLNYVHGLTYGNGRFVSGASSGTIAYSI